MSTAELPTSARVVVIGGGVGGASVAFHLAELGQPDVVVLDRAELTSGSTFHSAGLVGQLRADPTLTRMNMYSVELYRRLQASDTPVSWRQSGGIKLASSPQRLEEIRRQISWARTFDLPLHEISPDEAQERFPLLDLDGVLGAAYLESDGYLDPSQLCYALAGGARAMGVQIRTHTRVLGINVVAGAVAGVRTDRGDIACEVIVNCGGMFAAEIGRMAGVRVPLVPMSHQYLVTEALLDRGTNLPTLRDPDLLVYFRQEVDGLLMGGYERNPEPFTATARTFDAVPGDFNGKLLPERWSRMEEIAANAAKRVPAMADLGVRTLINGPEAFTPDNEFCLGETEVAGLFVAAGFCAHGIAGAGGIGKVMAEWIVNGDPGFDVWHMDVNRFAAHYRSPSYTLARTMETYSTYYDIPFPGLQKTSGRPLRVSSVYEWHREHGAHFGEKAGWERVDYYADNTDPSLEESLRPAGWAGRGWSSAVSVEHRSTREIAGLFDESSFAKFVVRGADAVQLLQWVCDNDVARAVGDVTYTQALNRRGGIECDFTVTRTGPQEFLIVTGTALGTHDMAWLRRQARARRAEVTITDVTGQFGCFAIWGPRARDILRTLTPDDLDDFAFMTSREIVVADVPLRALRVTFVGELGWELYAPAEYGRALWSALWAAGRPHGMVAAGYRAIESMRLEKSYRVWGSDISAETNPYEAGLGFCVKLDKPGGFCGRDALVAAKAAGVSRRLRAIVLDDPLQVVLGSEPVRIDGAVAGRVTSGGQGYTTGKSIAFAYLPVACGPGTRVEIDLLGTWIGAAVVAEPLFDPTSSRVREL